MSGTLVSRSRLSQEKDRSTRSRRRRRDFQVKNNRLGSSRLLRGRRAELFNITLFNLMQRRFAAEEVGVQLRRKLAGHRTELVEHNLSPGNRAACRDQVRSPLKH